MFLTLESLEHVEHHSADVCIKPQQFPKHDLLTHIHSNTKCFSLHTSFLFSSVIA